MTIQLRNKSIDDAVRVLLIANQLAQKVLDNDTVIIYPNVPAKQREYQELTVKAFYLANARRMAMAGKILFPVPNRRVSKRLYRLAAPTLVLWGERDALIPPVYADRWGQLIPGAHVERIASAGHMLPWEAPDEFTDAVTRFLD